MLIRALQITRPTIQMGTLSALVILIFSLQTFANRLNHIQTPHPLFVSVTKNPQNKRMELLVGNENTLSAIDLMTRKESMVTRSKIQELITIPQGFLEKEAPTGGVLIVDKDIWYSAYKKGKLQPKVLIYSEMESEYHHVHVLDVNNDGSLDILACKYQFEQVSQLIWIKKTFQGWTEHVLRQGVCSNSLAIAELNSNRKSLITDTDDGHLIILHSMNPYDDLTQGLFIKTLDKHGHYLTDIQVADLNGNGNKQIIVVTQNHHVLDVWAYDLNRKQVHLLIESALLSPTHLDFSYIHIFYPGDSTLKPWFLLMTGSDVRVMKPAFNGYSYSLHKIFKCQFGIIGKPDVKTMDGQPTLFLPCPQQDEIRVEIFI